MCSHTAEIAAHAPHPNLRQHREALHPHSSHPHGIRVLISVGVRLGHVPKDQRQRHHPKHPHRICFRLVSSSKFVGEGNSVHSQTSNAQVEQWEQELTHAEVWEVPVEQQGGLAAEEGGNHAQQEHFPGDACYRSVLGCFHGEHSEANTLSHGRQCNQTPERGIQHKSPGHNQTHCQALVQQDLLAVLPELLLRHWHFNPEGRANPLRLLVQCDYTFCVGFQAHGWTIERVLGVRP
mmetsp:Transcript_37162/g.89372  ORF Transcript_37162/g.89372 Transcript_37162/m.89372 type:complete len:236 (-) Transcript_37162:20-727(-)